MSIRKKLKFGVVGLKGIGNHHLSILVTMDEVELVGVCDIVPEIADAKAEQYGAPAYYRYTELFEKSGLEAVIIAVPHYDHPAIAIDAFAKGIHVLCEKPVAVHINDAKKTIGAYETAKQVHPDLVFGLMFQERTLPFYAKIKEMVVSGELGQLTRATWVNTAWFRTQAYYDGGDWRATWAGEGGGILTNQCPHNLDFYQWVFGVPKRISGHANIGKYHDIEVEDEVTAYFEHENGMVGHFIVSTAESPGTNRLEIIGENGKLVYEKDKLVFVRNKISMLKHLRETKARFDTVETEETEVFVNQDAPSGHKAVIERFVQVVLYGNGDLIAHGSEGIHSVTIANGIMLSSFTKHIVHVPFDADEYEHKLKELIQNSKFVKNTRIDVDSDFSKSFQ